MVTFPLSRIGVSFMRLLRASLGSIVLLAAGCSSDSSGDGVTSFTPGAAGSAPAVPGDPSAPAPADGAAGSSTTPGVPSDGSSTEGGPDPVALDPDAPVPGNDGATGAGGASSGADAGGVAVIPTEPPLTGDPLFPTPVTPSAGCANGSTTQGAASLTIRGAQADYVVTLPPGYSPTTPTPLAFGFHGRNRTHVEFQTIDASGIQTELGSRYIMVYPKSQGGPGWNFDAEVPPSIEFFDALYAQMTQNYCVDLSHVFAVGHSSGGYFSIILACRYGSLLRGIGTVAGAIQEQMCTTERVAGLLIHGPNDTVVNISGGRGARDQLLARNGCQQGTGPGVEAQCQAYQGCAEGFPVQWCEHTEPTYSDGNGPTNHGWPSFASRAIRTFLEALP
jgi:polyhydroxybutyrate depolymerase